MNNQLQSKRIELTKEKMDQESNRTGKFHQSVIRLLCNLASYTMEKPPPPSLPIPSLPS
jgi:hypothetical protein